MTKNVKAIAITLTSVTILAGLGFLGFLKFTRSIHQQRSCEWANIDNIELHTGIDIPKILTSDCEYNKKLNTKTASFSIDTGNVDISKYILRNKFNKIQAMTGFGLEELLKNEHIAGLKSTSGLYYAKGSSLGETWQSILENPTGKLWVTIKFKD
ncbi:MAG: hypothetical protein H7X99_08595 [Saprospiraceae bacterium]|nr:hypothetical protein [Saprospiraceae bacterium]